MSAGTEVPTANPGQVATHGAPYTGHGHLVAGFSPEGWDRPNVAARCGGEALCTSCSTDAARIRMVEGFEQPRLGYATTEQLLDELAARVDTTVDLGPVLRGNLMTAVGDLKEAFGKFAPALLRYRTAGSGRG